MGRTTGRTTKGLMTAGRLDGIVVRVHWTLLVGSGVLALAAWPHVLPALGAVLAYFMSMLIHEWGHAYVARRRRCPVHGIELYPLVGFTRLGEPDTHSDHCAIAWAGVVAQAIAVAPVVAILATVGYTGVAAVNAFLSAFAWVSALAIVLNLLPIAPLDGALAWSRLPVVPTLPGWVRVPRKKPVRGWNKLGRTAGR